MQKVLFWIILILFITGCGGSGGSGGTVSDSATNLTLVVNWPDLTRQADAPRFAKSVRVTVTPQYEQPITWIANRPTAATGGAAAVVGPKFSKSVDATLTATFFLDPNATGGVAGAAGLQVKVENGRILQLNGQPLTKINVGSAIKQLMVGAQDVEVGQTTQILLSGVNEQDELTALDPGFAVFSIAQPEGNGRAEVVGTQIKGVQSGAVGVIARAGALEASSTVEILPRSINTARYGPKLVDVDFDSTRNRAWVISSTGVLSCMNSANGTIEKSYTIGGTPDRIAVSQDGAFAYLSDVSDGRLRQVGLATGTINWALKLPTDRLAGENDGIVLDIDVNPTNPQEVAVGMRSRTTTAEQGPVIIRNGAVLSQFPEFFGVPQGAYLSGNRYLGLFSNLFIRSEISELGAVDTNTGLETETSGNFIEKSGRLFFTSGAVHNTNSLEKVGDTRQFAASRSLLATDTANDLVWLLRSESTVTITAINASTLQLVEQVALSGVPAGSEERGFKRLSGNSIGFVSQGSLYVIPAAPGL